MKNYLLLILITIVVSCKNSSHNSKEQDETEVGQKSEIMNEIESNISKVVIRVDNIFRELMEARNRIKKAENKIVNLTEGTDDYLRMKTALEQAKKDEQELLDRINIRYENYMYFPLTHYYTDAVIQSCCDVIKESIRIELLKEYQQTLKDYRYSM